MGKKEKKQDVVPDDDEEPHLTTVDDVDDKIAVLRRGAPPPALSFEDFRDSFGLNGTGINPHKSRDTREILQSDLTSVFGPQRAKSGFWFGDVKNPKVKSAIARLYPIVYQKPSLIKTKLIGKEFAIGIVADVVKGLDVDWASFAHITNRNQRSAWQKKMKAALEMKAALTERNFSDILEEEDMDSLMQGDILVKGEPGELPCGGLGGQSSSWIENKKRESNDLHNLVELELLAVRIDMEAAVKEKQRLDSKVEGVRIMLDSMDATCKEYKKKLEGCTELHELPTMQMTFDFYEATFKRTAGEYNAIVADQQLQASLHEKLVQREAFLVSQQSILAKQLSNLRSGRPGLALHPHPMCNSLELEVMDSDSIMVTNCVLCDCPFSYNDILVCSCRHVYHPWCAVSWFSTSVKCVEKSCSVVHPDWYKSFGFGELPISLEEKADALDCDLQRKLALSERTAAAKRTGADIGMLPSTCASCFCDSFNVHNVNIGVRV